MESTSCFQCAEFGSKTQCGSFCISLQHTALVILAIIVAKNTNRGSQVHEGN